MDQTNFAFTKGLVILGRERERERFIFAIVFLFLGEKKIPSCNPQNILIKYMFLQIKSLQIYLPFMSRQNENVIHFELFIYHLKSYGSFEVILKMAMVPSALFDSFLHFLIPTENMSHCMPTFRYTTLRSGVSPLFTNGTPEYTC